MTENNNNAAEVMLQSDFRLTMKAAESLNRIYKKVAQDALCEETIKELSDDIRLIAERFHVSPKAAVLLAAILEKSSSGSGCDEEDLALFVGCTNIEFIGFHEALNELDSNNIINVSRNHRRSFRISQDALKSIEKDSPFEPVKLDGLTTEELFTRFRLHVCNLRSNVIDEDRFLEEMNGTVELNQQLLFCRKVSECILSGGLTDTEQRMFYYLCHRYVSHGEQSVTIDELLNLIGFMEDGLRVKRHIALEDTGLQTAGLVSFGCNDGFIDNESLSLTDAVKDTWFQEIRLAKAEPVRHKDLIPWDSIGEQQLFYNEREGEMVEQLGRLLQEENLKAVQERLVSQGMPKGFSCVFHGGPGSGKTATLKALARATRRDLFWVDLSSIRSKWVGESEQKVKGLFDTYRKLVHSSERAPILAVNEADAFFTRRVTNAESSVDQLNNTITDIILNELETLDGILIATTNLVGNIMGERDNAMERRFLYKIQFDAPCEDVRAKIWKSKLPDLTDEQAGELGSRFPLSGGNIDNVARKSTIDFVLNGTRPDMETLLRYCGDETVQKKEKERRRIGF